MEYNKKTNWERPRERPREIGETCLNQEICQAGLRCEPWLPIVTRILSATASARVPCVWFLDTPLAPHVQMTTFRLLVRLRAHQMRVGLSALKVVLRAFVGALLRLSTLGKRTLLLWKAMTACLLMSEAFNTLVRTIYTVSALALCFPDKSM